MVTKTQLSLSCGVPERISKLAVMT